MLVFAGTGAIVADEATGAVTHAGVALGFGAAGRFPRSEAGSYLAAQVAGAVAASLLLRTLFPDSVTLGATLPRGAEWRSFVLEVVLTWFLMLVVLCVSAGAKEKGVT